MVTAIQDLRLERDFVFVLEFTVVMNGRARDVRCVRCQRIAGCVEHKPALHARAPDVGADRGKSLHEKIEQAGPWADRQQHGTGAAELSLYSLPPPIRMVHQNGSWTTASIAAVAVPAPPTPFRGCGYSRKSPPGTPPP